MKLHNEGYPIIGTTFLVLAILSLGIWFIPVHLHVKYFLFTGFFLLLIWTIYFFRYPIRKINKDDNHILSTADGKIVVIEEVFEEEYFKEKRLMISVFMSPMNVHINWYPFKGEVKYSKYHPGHYFIAYHPKSSEYNERASVALEKQEGQDILIRQVAGVMARRVICYSKKGDKVKQGSEMGIIKFGSRVDFFLPLTVRVNVKMNQKVKAQQTVIAYFD